MKVFIKSLLVISLLSGNIANADTAKTINLELLTSSEKVERIEQLEELMSNAQEKRRLIEEHLRQNGNLIRNNNLKAAAGSVGMVASLFLMYRSHKIKNVVDSTVKYVVGLAGALVSMSLVIRPVTSLPNLEFLQLLRELSNDQAKELYVELGTVINESTVEVNAIEESLMQSM